VLTHKLDGNELWSCGWNYDGELGLNHKENTTAFRRVRHPVLDTKYIKQVACGGGHTVVLTQDNQLWAVGANSTGKLALGSFSKQQSTFQLCNIEPLHNQIICQISCGASHTMVLTGKYFSYLNLYSSLTTKDSGSLFMCGSGNYGQLGLGINRNRNCLTEVKPVAGLVKTVCTSSYSNSTVIQNGMYTIVL
jgi:RCC1 and BTB domain-containing protein